MKEQKLIIDRLKELTKDQIAKETGATKVANVRFRLFIILFHKRPLKNAKSSLK